MTFSYFSLYFISKTKNMTMVKINEIGNEQINVEMILIFIGSSGNIKKNVIKKKIISANVKKERHVRNKNLVLCRHI